MAAQEYVDIRTVEPGTKLRLVDDSVVEVTENPADGYWILGRYLTSPSEPSREGKVEMVLWSDIVARI
jgi:hypothetical protein